MTPRLRAALLEHQIRYKGAVYGGEPSPWLFHHERRNRKAMPGDRIVSKRAALISAVKRAKIPYGRDRGFVTHDLRHRRVTEWLADDRNPAKVQSAIGHKHAATTAWYTHLVKEHLRSLVDDESASAEAATG